MKNLYIDFDGVIVDTINMTYDMIHELKLDFNNKEEIESFYRNLDWKLLLKETPILNDSINCIKKLIDSNKFDISILTHVNSLHEIEEKVKFIRKYFKDITIIPVPKSISKTKMIHTEGSILIDDYTENLKEWEKEGGISIYFSPLLKSKGYKVINKLDQILDMELV